MYVCVFDIDNAVLIFTRAENVEFEKYESIDLRVEGEKEQVAWVKKSVLAEFADADGDLPDIDIEEDSRTIEKARLN